MKFAKAEYVLCLFAFFFMFIIIIIIIVCSIHSWQRQEIVGNLSALNEAGNSGICRVAHPFMSLNIIFHLRSITLEV